MSSAAIIEIGTSAAIFIGMWAILGNWFFKPYLKLLDERTARTTGDEKAATDKLRESGEVLEQVEHDLRDVRVQLITKRDERVAAAHQQAQSVVSAAADEAAAHLGKAREEIEQLKQNAERELEAEASQLASLVVERVLGKGNVSPAIH